MAINSTIRKMSINIADMDRHYYQTHDLVVAQHPSESDLRMMIRVIAFVANAEERLEFTKGLCENDEPELWRKALNGEIEQWIDLGQPDEKRIRKACGRSQEVIIYTYDFRKAEAWWNQIKNKLTRFTNLRVMHIRTENIEAMVHRTMRLQCNIQDGAIYLSDEEEHRDISIEKWDRL